MGQSILAEIGSAFGADFLLADGALNRAKLRAHVFENKEERLKLEEILHPAIRAQALKQLAENESKLQPNYQILVLPLLC